MARRIRLRPETKKTEKQKKKNVDEATHVFT